MNNRENHQSKKQDPINNDGELKHNLSSSSANDSPDQFNKENNIGPGDKSLSDADQTTCFADDWQISENSMLTDEVIKANLLTTQEMEDIIDTLTEESIEAEEAIKAKAQSAGRRAAETLITSLSESISGTKTDCLNTEKIDRAKARVDTQSIADSLVPDETADFPTSSNPFKQATNSGLLDIAKSKGTTEATLLWLSQNPDSTIRSAVAGNPRASKQILAKLIRDHDGHVKLATLDNPELTSDLVVELLNDRNPLVSLRAYEILNERRKLAGLEPIKDRRKVNTVNDLPALSPAQKRIKNAQEMPITASGAHEAIEFLRMMANRHSTPIERLKELATHPDTLVRAAVARNSRSPIDVLWGLANDKNTRVKQNLIKNESCPLELLFRLKNDPDKLVSVEAQKELERFEV